MPSLLTVWSLRLSAVLRIHPAILGTEEEGRSWSEQREMTHWLRLEIGMPF